MTIALDDNTWMNIQPNRWYVVVVFLSDIHEMTTIQEQACELVVGSSP